MIYRKFPKTASLPVTCHPLGTYEISTSMLRRRNPRLSVIGQKIGSCIQKIGFTSPLQKIKEHERTNLHEPHKAGRMIDLILIGILAVIAAVVAIFLGS
jgi:hypothetical protein